jgi:hypothetical protein
MATCALLRGKAIEKSGPHGAQARCPSSLQAGALLHSVAERLLLARVPKSF